MGVDLYELPEIEDNQVIKLFDKDGGFVILANHNTFGGVCDCCFGLKKAEYVRFEIATIE